MEILIFTVVDVRSHITFLVAMVTDHTSTPPPQVSLPVRKETIVGAFYPDIEEGGRVHFGLI